MPSPTPALNVDAAVDANSLGGHVVTLGDDVAHAGGDFFGGAKAVHGDFFEDALTDVFWDRPEHVGFCEAGADGIDGDAVTRYLQRDRFGEADDACFGCRVVGLSDVAR